MPSHLLGSLERGLVLYACVEGRKLLVILLCLSHPQAWVPLHHLSLPPTPLTLFPFAFLETLERLQVWLRTMGCAGDWFLRPCPPVGLGPSCVPSLGMDADSSSNKDRLWSWRVL